MPIYEYACSACGHTFEEWQKMSDPPVKTCPKCKKKKVEKLISHTAFQLKGGGWYKDLYSSSKGGTSSTSESAGSGSSSDSGSGSDSSNKSADSGAKESKSEAKSDGKSESKKESKGDAKDAKKKDSPKKSETRAA